MSNLLTNGNFSQPAITREREKELSYPNYKKHDP